ncbi:MAG: D-cysteine desulfhydrase family protein [Candidatus Bathyarchaeota archaeon]|nr:D-cysteine desulfhydrase family protein [Candidatus Bathyarchaeota archaeon]
MRKQKTCFAGFPTPLQPMPRLTEALGGPNLYVKRDDMTDLSFGGNKARKLEFLFADAKNKGADTMISTGAVQSNCACMVASAARRLGMKPVLVLVGPEPAVYDGNLLLDKLLGAEINFLETYGPHLEEYMNKLAKEYSAKGHTPYVVSAGASVPLTVPGYVLALQEVVSQFEALNKTVDYIVCTCGTGGTQAGLVLGTKLLGVDTKVVGASVFASKEDASKNIVEMANGCARLYGADVCVGVDDVVVFDDYIKEGYGVINNDVKDAIKLMAQTEGIFLDPIYTGKAMVMLIDKIKKGYFKKDDNVVFFHTGGLAALCLYRDELSKL